MRILVLNFKVIDQTNQILMIFIKKIKDRFRKMVNINSTKIMYTVISYLLVYNL